MEIHGLTTYSLTHVCKHSARCGCLGSFVLRALREACWGKAVGGYGQASADGVGFRVSGSGLRFLILFKRM